MDFKLLSIHRIATVFFLALAFVAATPIAVAAGLKPLHFATVGDMIKHYADYSAEERSFQVISESPLKIQLAPDVILGEDPDNVQRELRRAALYGVFRTLVHTTADEITVIAVPREVSAINKTVQILDKPSLTVNVTRAQAVLAVNSFLKVSRTADLVKPEKMGPTQVDNWVPTFEKLYFSNSGQERLLQAIRVAGGEVLNYE